MNKVSHTNKKNQASKQNISFSFEDVIFNAGKKKQAILNVIYYLAEKYKICAPSHGYIAEKAGASLDYTQQVLTEANKEGLIVYERRYNDTNVYYLPEPLKNPDVRNRLASVLPYLRGILCLSMLLSVVALSGRPHKRVVVSKNFSSQQNDLVEKPGLNIRDKEIITISLSNNRDNVRHRKVVIEKISQNKLNSKFLYPFLCDSMRYLAIHMGLTPVKACYLACIEQDIADEVLHEYMLCHRNGIIPKNKSQFIGSLLKKSVEKHSVSFEYRFISSIITHFGLDTEWKSMTLAESSILQQSVRHIGSKIELQEELRSHKAKESAPSQAAIQREKDRIQRLKKNPYSIYYDGHSPLEEKRIIKKNPPQIPPAPPKLSVTPISTDWRKDFEVDIQKYSQSINMFLTEEMITGILLNKYPELERTYIFKVNKV